jgi:hypothetical protein
VVMCLAYVYESRAMKPVECFKKDGRRNLTKVHCKHIWKCHNETPGTTNMY